MQITFFPTGSTMAFEKGEQVPIAQESWLIVFARYLESKGIDPTEPIFEMPDMSRMKIFKFEDGGEYGYNWERV